MKKTITRIITFMMAAAIIASMAVTGVFASTGNPESMLALGDSITTGYGLDNYVGGDTPYLCDSYGNLIAKALGLEGGKSYINKAVNGATSSDLLALLPSLTNELKSSELIIVSIGGNDLLQSIPLVASALAGKTVTSLEEAVNVLITVTPDKFATLATNTDFQTKMGAVLTKYATNLSAIAAIIKENAPDAHVIFLKQYNPMKNVLGFADFGNFADTMIGAVNTSMETVCSASGFDIADVPSVINVNAVGLTNILNYDIHPNAKGHIEIAKLLASHLGLTLEFPEETTLPEETTKTPEETTNAPEDTTKTPEDTTKTPEETTAIPEESTGAEADESAEVSDDGSDIPEPAIKNGCFSSVSAGAVILISLCALAVLKKKN